MDHLLALDHQQRFLLVCAISYQLMRSRPLQNDHKSRTFPSFSSSRTKADQIGLHRLDTTGRLKGTPHRVWSLKRAAARTDIIFFMEVKSNKPVTSASALVSSICRCRVESNISGEKPLIRPAGAELRTRSRGERRENRIAYLIHKNI